MTPKSKKKKKWFSKKDKIKSTVDSDAEKTSRLSFSLGGGGNILSFKMTGGPLKYIFETLEWGAFINLIKNKNSRKINKKCCFR